MRKLVAIWIGISIMCLLEISRISEPTPNPPDIPLETCTLYPTQSPTIPIAPTTSTSIPQSSDERRLLSENFNNGIDWSTWQTDWSDGDNPTGNPAIKLYELPVLLCRSGNCYLEGYTTFDSGHSKNTALLYTGNPTTIGRWKYDSRLSTQNDSYNLLVLGDDKTSFDGQNYTFAHTLNGIVFYKNINHTLTNLLNYTDVQNDGAGHTLEMTRDSNGVWRFYFDTRFIGEVVDNQITDLRYLFIGRYGSIDNIIVSTGKP